MAPASAEIADLVAYVAGRPQAGAWRGWAVAPVAGGGNNLIYRATRGADDLAIKLARRDARDRAGREHAALTLLAARGLDLAPRALLLDRDSHALPVVVQTWLAGEVGDAPPGDEAGWEALLRHYAALHQVTPAAGREHVDDAVNNVASVAQGRAMIAEQLAALPAEGRPAGLEALVERAVRAPIAEPPGGRVALCRSDSNTRNFIRRPSGWASVDWENSGWGEPAFEIVDLITHPAYAEVPRARWAWAVQRYAELSGDAHAPAKIAAFEPLFLAWWAVRAARLRYELPRGLDARLAGGYPDAHLAALCRRYAELAAAALGAV